MFVLFAISTLDLSYETAAWVVITTHQISTFSQHTCRKIFWTGFTQRLTCIYIVAYDPLALHNLLHYYRLTHVARAGPFSL